MGRKSLDFMDFLVAVICIGIAAVVTIGVALALLDAIAP